MSREPPIAALAQGEIEALHEFFVDWMSVAGPEPMDFGACEDTLAGDFVMVTPDGTRHERRAVVERLRRARHTIPAPFAITILDARSVWSAESAVVMAYIERQQRGEQTRQRRSAALFTRSSTAPRGVVWRYLQETWMVVGNANQG